MKITLLNQQTTWMIQGSSIYSTGGGIAYETQKTLFSNLFKENKELKLVSLDDLSENDYVCTTYAVGSAGNTNYDLSRQLLAGLHALENVTKKKFSALFPGETNADILAFQAASAVNLPVLDADGTGGRAVPEIRQDNFAIARKSITPLVAVTPDKNVSVLEHASEAGDIEKFVRAISSKLQSGLVAVIDHPIQVKDAKNVLTLGVLSRSIQLGEYIFKNKKNELFRDGFVQKINGKLLIEGQISHIETNHSMKDGFLTGYYYVKDSSKNTLKVFIKNENIACWKNDELLLTAPDSIITFDLDTLLGVHNSTLKVGQRVLVIGKPATELWKSKKGQELFSPKHFGLSISNKELDI